MFKSTSDSKVINISLSFYKISLCCVDKTHLLNISCRNQQLCEIVQILGGVQVTDQDT